MIPDDTWWYLIISDDTWCLVQWLSQVQDPNCKNKHLPIEASRYRLRCEVHCTGTQIYRIRRAWVNSEDQKGIKRFIHCDWCVPFEFVKSIILGFFFHVRAILCSFIALYWKINEAAQPNVFRHLQAHGQRQCNGGSLSNSGNDDVSLKVPPKIPNGSPQH